MTISCSNWWNSYAISLLLLAHNNTPYLSNDSNVRLASNFIMHAKAAGGRKTAAASLIILLFLSIIGNNIKNAFCCILLALDSSQIVIDRT